MFLSGVKYALVISGWLCLFVPAWAQYPLGDAWYTNPLGFEPVKLHTANGFLVPALAVGVSLLVARQDSALVRGPWVYQSVSASYGYKYPYTGVYQLATGFLFPLRRWLSVGVEAIPLYAADDYNRVVGFGVRPLARFYPIASSTFKLYFESGGGLIRFGKEFPAPNTYDSRTGLKGNGITQYGVGAEWYPSDRFGLSVSAFHLHISNGDREGVARNPSHDSNGVGVGVLIRLGGSPGLGAGK